MLITKKRKEELYNEKAYRRKKRGVSILTFDIVKAKGNGQGESIKQVRVSATRPHVVHL